MITVLRKNLARSIQRGHPWIYRDALMPVAGAAPAAGDGAIVEVRTRDGVALGWGYWDAQSPIAVRMMQAGGVAAPAGRGCEAEVRQRLEAALRVRLARLDIRTTNAFRWVHGEGDRLPGIHVDVYAGVAVVRYDGAGARSFFRDLPHLARQVGKPLGLQAVVDRDRRGAASAPEELDVLENGIHFIVDLAHGQKGGLFLDQRENRAAIGGRAAGQRVLNLFGYTGGFSLYAAASGAVRTDTVDLARPAITAARRNFERNGLSLAHAGFHAEDAFSFLAAAARRGETWDIVISDPPSFAPNKRSLPAARRAYRKLHTMAAAVTAPGGLYCPASCSSHFSKDEFLASVVDAFATAGKRWILERFSGAGFDHPVLPIFPEGDYLKFAIGRVSS